MSGGKDSTFQTWYAINKLGLRPLCVNIAPYLGTDVGAANLRNIAENLPVDVISLIPNQTVQTKLSLIGMREHADPLSYPFLYLCSVHYAYRLLKKSRSSFMARTENGNMAARRMPILPS